MTLIPKDKKVFDQFTDKRASRFAGAAVSERSLRASVIRLAYQRPELRGHLLPLLRQASSVDIVAKVGYGLRTFASSLAPNWTEDSALEWAGLLDRNRNLFSYYRPLIRGGKFVDLPDEVLDEILSWEAPLLKLFKKMQSILNKVGYPQRVANMMAGLTERAIYVGHADPVQKILESLVLSLDARNAYKDLGAKGEQVARMIAKLSKVSLKIGADTGVSDVGESVTDDVYDLDAEYNKDLRSY